MANEEKKFKWLYVGIDFAIFFLLLIFTGNWILAFIVSVVAGFLLETLDPLSKM